MIDDALKRRGEEPASDDGESMTLLAVATSLLKHRRLLLLCGLAGLALSWAVLVPRDRRYTVSTTFVPQSRRSGGGLAGIAAQFGVAVPGGESAEQSPAFYVDLVQTRAILGAVVDSPRVIPGQRGVARLTAFFADDERDSLRQRDEAIRELRRALGVGFSQRTGVVTVSATMTSPVLAKDVVEQLLREVTRFNTNSRQTQAAAERRFTEQRLAEAANDLRAAEGRQLEFMSRNREYRNAPQLLFEYDRLSREVALRQQLYGTLAEAFDHAKIDEVRDTPLMSVIDRAEMPARPDSRGLARWGIVFGLLGIFVGCLIALLIDYFAANERGNDAMLEFQTARRAAAADLRRPWRLIRTRSATGAGTV